MSNDPKKFAVVDASDWPVLSGGTWAIVKTGYCVWRLRQGKVSHNIPIHRVIMRSGIGQFVDHRDHDKLNNRRRNLRHASKSTNGQNKLKHLREGVSSSRFKGVAWHKKNSSWRAYIVIPSKKGQGRAKQIGSFQDEQKAAKAYDSAARKQFGKYACLNFPRKGEISAHQ